VCKQGWSSAVLLLQSKQNNHNLMVVTDIQ
jgi:hypothetical protein